ncbi:hypothetical protein KCU81_g861, partial [Aureobasidium melanogenum]
MIQKLPTQCYSDQSTKMNQHPLSVTVSFEKIEMLLKSQYAVSKALGLIWTYSAQVAMPVFEAQPSLSHVLPAQSPQNVLALSWSINVTVRRHESAGEEVRFTTANGGCVVVVTIDLLHDIYFAIQRPVGTSQPESRPHTTTARHVLDISEHKSVIVRLFSSETNRWAIGGDCCMVDTNISRWGGTIVIEDDADQLRGRGNQS